MTLACTKGKSVMTSPSDTLTEQEQVVIETMTRLNIPMWSGEWQHYHQIKKHIEIEQGPMDGVMFFSYLSIIAQYVGV
jgi:hypothetical protein